MPVLDEQKTGRRIFLTVQEVSQGRLWSWVLHFDSSLYVDWGHCLCHCHSSFLLTAVDRTNLSARGGWARRSAKVWSCLFTETVKGHLTWEGRVRWGRLAPWHWPHCQPCSLTLCRGEGALPSSSTDAVIFASVTWINLKNMLLLNMFVPQGTLHDLQKAFYSVTV